jgi:hypothetical protein
MDTGWREAEWVTWAQWSLAGTLSDVRAGAIGAFEGAYIDEM